MDMKNVYVAALDAMMARDRHVVVLDADLGRSIGPRSLYEKYPKQCFEAGIAEQDMASIAAGMASYGFKPWIETFTPFATRRICDQITISIAYAKRNVKIVGSDPGITAELNGGTHMSFEDFGVLRSVPDIVLFEAADEVELAKALPAINDYEGCVYLRLFRKSLPKVYGDDYRFELFKTSTLREGADLTVFASGIMVNDALEAARLLAEAGVECEVVNVHTIKPIDREGVIAAARKTGAVLTVENHNVIGGLHSAVLEALAQEKIPVCAVGVHDRFGEVGKMPYLRKQLGMTVEDIVAQGKKAVSLK
ncbi:MAG: transketolase family protein [Oscillospiraceae bacterium]|nr:transketolase family protein [Oscillospiraceae bacterium]